MNRADDRCAGTARDGGPCTFTRAGHADGRPHAFVDAFDEVARLRGELAEALGQWLCSAGHRHGPHDVCNNPFPPAPTPAESTPVQATPALEHDKNVIDGLRQNAQADEIDRRAFELRHPHPAPPDGIRERLAEHDCVIARMQHAWIGHDSRLAALEAKGEPGTHAKGAVELRPGVYVMREIKSAFADLGNKANGEPVTHAFVPGPGRNHGLCWAPTGEPNDICGHVETDPSHAKGAKP